MVAWWVRNHVGRRSGPAWQCLLAVLALAVAACGAPATPDPAPPRLPPAATTPSATGTGQSSGTPQAEPVELRFAWWGSQDRHNRTIKAIELFNRLHPNINITYEFGNYQDYFTRMATLASAGTLPDLMQQDYATLTQWVSNNLLLSLDDYVNDRSINLTDVPRASIDGGRIGGKLYALNLGNNSQTVMLDVDAYRKAGLPLPTSTWTWDEFEKNSLALHARLGVYGAGPTLSDIQLWKSLYLGYGQWAFTTDGKALGYSDDQHFVDYLKMLARLQAAGAIPSQQQDIAQYRSSSVEARPIVAGKSAMEYIWSNQLVAVWTAAGAARHFKLTTLPRPQTGKSENYLKPSQFISIATTSAHPGEAAMFVDFMTNNVDANKILLGERGVPISPRIQQAIAPLLTPAQIETQNFLSLIEKDSSPLPPPDPSTQQKLQDEVYQLQLVDPVLLKQATAEGAMAQFRKTASQVLAAP
jgi:multiple sugar transport system substrate-binding protein